MRKPPQEKNDHEAMPYLQRSAALPLALLLLGAVFVYTGVSRGEAHIVFMKAVTVCLECIGIG